MIFIQFTMKLGTLNEFTGNLNLKLISVKWKTLKQTWANFQSEAAWHWPGPTAIMAQTAQAGDVVGRASATVTACAWLTAARSVAAQQWFHHT
jgi:hypothetical protein